MAIEEEASSAVAGEEDGTGLLIDQSGEFSVNQRCLEKQVLLPAVTVSVFFQRALKEAISRSSLDHIDGFYHEITCIASIALIKISGFQCLNKFLYR